jgi:hypothetical protein
VEEEIETKYGVTTREKLKWKPKDELDEMQRQCVDTGDVKGQFGTPVYILADKEKALDDIIKEEKEYLKATGDEGQDIEELKEVIIERVTIRQMKRASADTSFQSRIFDRPEGISEEL